MGPKKRRGRKQSVEDRTVTTGTTEAIDIVSGDYGADEVQTTPEADLDDHVAQLLSPVTNDKKLSSAVLVLENCLLSTSAPHPLNSLASPSAVGEAPHRTRPGRKRGSLGIRRGVTGRTPIGEGQEGTLPVDSEEFLTQKHQRAGRKQRRGVVRRVSRGRIDAGPSVVVATVVADDPNSDVDVESSAVETGPIPTEEEQDANGKRADDAETFIEKRKRKKAFKKEKHTAKKRRKDDAVTTEDEPEDIKVDDEDEEGEEVEGESYATWMVSPLSGGDEEKMIFKRQKKVSPPVSEASELPGRCLAPAPANAVADFLGSAPDLESPVDTLFVDPMEGDTQEEVDVEAICPKVDEPVDASFTVLIARKGRKNKKRDLKVVLESGTDVVNAGGRGRKGRKLARKNPGLREIEGSLELGASLGSRVTRSRRNGNGVATEAGRSSGDNQGLGGEDLAEEVGPILSGPSVEADPLEGPEQEVSPDVSALEEPILRCITSEVADELDGVEREAGDSEMNNKTGMERTEKAGETPISFELEDRCLVETPRLDAASILSSVVEEETLENVLGDVTNSNYTAPVLLQLSDQGSPGEPTARCDLDNAGVVSGSKSSPAILSEKTDHRNTEQLPSLVSPALHIISDSTTPEVHRKDGKSEPNDINIGISPIDLPNTEENRSFSPGTRSLQPERHTEEPANPAPGIRSSRFSTREKSDSGAAPGSPSLSLECYSEPSCEAAAAHDSDQSSNSLVASESCGVNLGDVASIPSNTIPDTEDGKLGEHDVEGADRDVENSVFPSSPDAIPKDRKPPDSGVVGGGVGSGDDTGFVPLKKRRLRVAEDGEKLAPEDAVMTRTSEDAQNPVTQVPDDGAEMATIDGQELADPASQLLGTVLPCANLAPKANMYVGTHVLSPGDLAGAVHRASQLGSRAIGIFLKPQKTWIPPALDPQEASKFKEALKEKGYSPHMILPHGSYLLNCGASDAEILSKSRESLVDDLRRCQMLGLPLFNFHPGFYSDSDSAEDCMLRVADSINYVHGKVADVITVIENMSGEANSIGSTFEQLKQIIDRVIDKSRVGVCLDTCHAFAAGYDLRNEAGYTEMMGDFDTTIGRHYLKAVHINDSRGDLGSRVDHHASLGKGKIGLTCFRLIMSDRSLENIPLILETPIAGHKQEIELLYSFV